MGHPAAVATPGQESHSSNTLGLPDLQHDLSLFQSALLSQIRLKDLHQHPELADTAYASCMKWFVGTVTSATNLQNHPAISGAVMSPYLQLIRKPTLFRAVLASEICMQMLLLDHLKH